MPAITIVFVHGWSVTDLKSYGKLPARLRDEAEKNGIQIAVEEIFLGRYISFRDEVRLPDISRAFRTALKDQLKNVSTFICITHSTGAPVIRDWWERYYKAEPSGPRMSHLIMLAPANFGSALAQLGKSTLSRIRYWFSGVEPGQGVLDWLELGSGEAWELNKQWITNGTTEGFANGYFPFVLTGQSIDRKLYDVINSYTGETGSDGVVRVASANLNATYIKLSQPLPSKGDKQKLVSGDLKLVTLVNAPTVPLRIITEKSHTGKTMGIMESVKISDKQSAETVNAIFDCIKVNTKEDYEKIIEKFRSETESVQKLEKVETEEKGLFLTDRYFIHDRYTMIIFRITDTEGYPINDFDLLLTVGKENNPNGLPEGFFIDRQQNKKNRNTVTYFLNYDILNGTNAVPHPVDKDDNLRAKADGIEMLGILLRPRPDSGFVKYVECKYQATKSLFKNALNPNSTTMIDIVLQRIVDKEVFRMTDLDGAGKFGTTRTSDEIVE